MKRKKAKFMVGQRVLVPAIVFENVRDLGVWVRFGRYEKVAAYFHIEELRPAKGADDDRQAD